jgi:hypothetical protein
MMIIMFCKEQWTELVIQQVGKTGTSAKPVPFEKPYKNRPKVINTHDFV